MDIGANKASVSSPACAHLCFRPLKCCISAVKKSWTMFMPRSYLHSAWKSFFPTIYLISSVIIQCCVEWAVVFRLSFSSQFCFDKVWDIFSSIKSEAGAPSWVSEAAFWSFVYSLLMSMQHPARQKQWYQDPGFTPSLSALLCLCDNMVKWSCGFHFIVCCPAFTWMQTHKPTVRLFFFSDSLFLRIYNLEFLHRPSSVTRPHGYIIPSKSASAVWGSDHTHRLLSLIQTTVKMLTFFRGFIEAISRKWKQLHTAYSLL